MAEDLTNCPVFTDKERNTYLRGPRCILCHRQTWQSHFYANDRVRVRCTCGSTTVISRKDAETLDAI